MHSPKHSGNRKPTACAKNAQRRSARQAHHIDAHSVAYGMRLLTLSKHQNPRWSLYRVCLSCDAVKHCFACKRKRTKEYFCTAAWTARKPNRRVCLQCPTTSSSSSSSSRVVVVGVAVAVAVAVAVGVVVVVVASEISYKKLAIRFSRLAAGSLLAAALLPLRLLLRLLVSAAAY